MNSGATAQRVYDDLKRSILIGHYRPGTRLEPAALGEALASSATPVRDALHRLIGEGLVETRTSAGFHVAELDAPALEDLYRWTDEVMRMIVRAVGAAPAVTVEGAYADALARLFSSLATRSANAEHARVVASLNDRLHAVRCAEASFFKDGQAQIEALACDLMGATRSAQAALTRFHRRRIRLAAEIVRQRYRLH